MGAAVPPAVAAAAKRAREDAFEAVAERRMMNRLENSAKREGVKN